MLSGAFWSKKVLNHLTPLTVVQKGHPATVSKPKVLNTTHTHLPTRSGSVVEAEMYRQAVTRENSRKGHFLKVSAKALHRVEAYNGD